MCSLSEMPLARTAWCPDDSKQFCDVSLGEVEYDLNAINEKRKLTGNRIFVNVHIKNFFKIVNI